ncbi:hypothetical protein [Flavobacterium sp. UMI-01]|uniref:hypothetical protein n=1 Tax=Flavobacterium sp. UMI-01 TaxID=1441053 RepID=UPI001C7CB8AF|nr:hypothetical protein [Flavobacterium sp. UMI-01]GIZ08983.1 hypothetical protein FUMI01_17100 [Flavobacterium sp. UMI-01]
MKTKIATLLLLSITPFCFAQIKQSKLIKGQVKNNLIPVEDVIVFNTKDHSGVNVNAFGSFEIRASINDTLVFSSLVFKSKRVVLTEKDFIKNQLIVPLDVFTNELAEIVILSKKQINPISGNTQKIVDLQYFDDTQSSPKNTVMPSDGSIEKGMDFVKIFKGVLKTLKTEYPEKKDFYKDTTFSDYVITHVDYSFLANTLQLKDHEIKLFLVYCENDSKSRTYMNPALEFQLLDFLTNKNKEFKRIIAN